MRKSLNSIRRFGNRCKIMHFADQLVEKSQGCPIVVGIDPNFDLMPIQLLPTSNSKANIKHSLLNFVKIIIDVSCDLVPAVKLQSAYFEQFGSLGIDVLAESIAYAKHKNLLVILDVKRGDIGSTSLAYAKYLEGQTILKNGVEIYSDLSADCMTVNPFLGEDSILPFVKTATKNKKGIFVLVKTSNPGSNMLQGKVQNGISVSEELASLVNTWGQESIGENGYSCIGAVIGATFPGEASKLRKLMPKAIVLVPGVGTQGGTIDTALANFNDDGKGAVIAISRSITYPEQLEVEKNGYESAVRRNLEKFAKIFATVKRDETCLK